MHVVANNSKKEREVNVTQINTPEEKEATIRELMKNDVVRQQCTVVANEINKYIKGWWTIDQLIKKSPYTNYRENKDMLDIMCLMGLCYRSVRKNDVVKYKIMLTNNDRLTLLQEELVTAKAEVKRIEDHIAALS